jgi:O-antigen/teichoic acid export membrane protein
VGAALLAWSIGLLASGGLAVRALARHLPSSDADRPRVRTLLRRLTSSALQHHGVNVALFSGSLLQPVIIGAVLPAQANADFTAARLATLLAFLAPFALAMAFFASSAETPRAVAARSASVTLASLGVAVVLTVVLWLAGDLILEIFGGHYEEALAALRIMSLAVPLLVFKDQYIALARATGRIRSILTAVVVAAVLEVVGTLSGSVLHGLDGALIGWVGVLGVEALYSIWGLRQIRREMAVPEDEPDRIAPTRDREPVASVDGSREAC